MANGNLLPRIVIYTTGGTIQCAKDELSGKVSPALTGVQILERLSALKNHFSMEIIEIFNMPGSDLTLENGLELSRSLSEHLPLLRSQMKQGGFPSPSHRRLTADMCFTQNPIMILKHTCMTGMMRNLDVMTAAEKAKTSGLQKV